MNLKELSNRIYVEYTDNGYEDRWNAAQSILKQYGEAGMDKIADIAELGLIVSEVAEAMEAVRDGDDKHCMVECADIIIRTLNFMSRRGYNAEKFIMDKDALNRTRGKLHGRIV